MKFEWDSTKAATNRRKHGISFEEAETVFSDPNAIEFYDAEHSDDEDREIIIGFSNKLRLLLVIYTERHGDTIRIISARKANATEKREYQSG
ncbi:MAG TPA: BrnT family toxin [Tepidisphaeraceae bacterium]|nr:BrnT family toxin [Tepidisphaeraceae bacterium]